MSISRAAASGALASVAASVCSRASPGGLPPRPSGFSGFRCAGFQGRVDHRCHLVDPVHVGHLRGHRAAPGPPRSPGPPGCSGATSVTGATGLLRGTSGLATGHQAGHVEDAQKEAADSSECTAVGRWKAADGEMLYICARGWYARWMASNR
ncbi:MAG: hypothetical protein OXG34_11755 [bacterium]|nr:hypothetical protein [bacterium]